MSPMIKINSYQHDFKRQPKRLLELPLLYQCKFLRDMVLHVSLRWSGTGHYQPLLHRAFKTDQTRSVVDFTYSTDACVFTDTAVSIAALRTVVQE